jgi:hypothetical protein
VQHVLVEGQAWRGDMLLSVLCPGWMLFCLRLHRCPQRSYHSCDRRFRNACTQCTCLLVCVAHMLGLWLNYIVRLGISELPALPPVVLC